MCIELCALCTNVSINTVQVAMRAHIFYVFGTSINEIIYSWHRKDTTSGMESAYAGYVQPELQYNYSA